MHLSLAVTDRKGTRTVDIEVSENREITLGRDPRSDVVLAAPNVSSAHARIVSDGQALLLEPLRGPNGTFVNERRIKQPQQLDTGDRIAIGPFTIVVRIDGEELPAESDERIVVEVDEDGVTRTVEVRGGTALIGRSRECHVKVATRRASSTHARLEVHDGRVLLTDLGSANGTFVNGDRVGGGAQRIDAAHTITIGDARLWARLASAAALTNDDVEAEGVVPPRRLVISIEEDGHEARVVEVEQGCVTIGRSAQSDIVLTRKRVSTYHAKLHVRPDGVLVEDAGSANGTFRQGVRVGAPEKLERFDVLTIADIRLTIDWID